MLTRLKIEDFAIIEQLTFEPGPGLVILTGETGAGKSIILDAIQALLGGPVDASMVRSGESKAHLEAIFEYSANYPEVDSWLAAQELADEPGKISLEREIRIEGRSSARVNGHVVNQTMLRELGSLLVDIHGQSEHLSLLNTRSHIQLLDRSAHHDELLSEYQTIYHSWQGVRKELRELQRMEQESSSRAELLEFQLNEIVAAHLVIGEDAALDSERTRLANAENLAAYCRDSLALLDEPTTELPSISDLLGEVSHHLHSLTKLDPSQSELLEQVEGMLDELTDLSRDLRGYSDQIEYNPQRLAQVEERIDLIHQLKRKYGGSIESIHAAAEKNRQLLDRITHASEQIEILVEEESHLLKELAKLGGELSRSRAEAAETMAKGVETQLADLRMEGARFSVQINRMEDSIGLDIGNGLTYAFDHTGLDRVEFLIAPNPGEGLKPLVKIASGGETSRLMLALKNVLAAEDQIPSLIFDEIDQGIGGRVGMVVGKKLWQLGQYHQVFCVTHLPQLAAYGDQHYRVLKHVNDGRTTTRIDQLTGGDRVQEIAQMLGNVSEHTLKSADELLTNIQNDRQTLN